jgi:hypothetical protein
MTHQWRATVAAGTRRQTQCGRRELPTFTATRATGLCGRGGRGTAATEDGRGSGRQGA